MQTDALLPCSSTASRHQRCRLPLCWSASKYSRRTQHNHRGKRPAWPTPARPRLLPSMWQHLHSRIAPMLKAQRERRLARTAQLLTEQQSCRTRAAWSMANGLSVCMLSELLPYNTCAVGLAPLGSCLPAFAARHITPLSLECRPHDRNTGVRADEAPIGRHACCRSLWLHHEAGQRSGE